MQRNIWFIGQEDTVLMKNLMTNAKTARMILLAMSMDVKINQLME
uniref:Uncharacterized protein n=1 Tax=Pithovirus LCPAC404 TaxID=2506597 RepID=A0A481ZDB4_9VIRU|nr:MAG: hypothetical protein LCPAC404_01790 [Pithovirus LCPAC404]